MGNISTTEGQVQGHPGSGNESKAAFLIANGWKEVPGDYGTTCWQAPPTCSPHTLYFALDAAYELETTGEGLWAYAAQEALTAALQAEDQRQADEREAIRFAKTGIRLGVYPNY